MLEKKKILGFCFVILGFFYGNASIVWAIPEAQLETISENCEAIREDLKTLQRNDSRARVYLGRYYETILSKFIRPLNVRLVENNLSNSGLIENQNNFAKARTNFVVDFIEYQKKLENLVAMDCKSEPAKFYDSLVEVRKRRKTVENDTEKLKGLMNEQKGLVIKLKESL